MKENIFGIPWYRLHAEETGGEGEGSAGTGGSGEGEGDTGGDDTGGEGDQGGEGEGEDGGPEGSLSTRSKTPKGEGEGDAEGEGEGDGEDEGGEKKSTGAPESYEDFNVPEGFEFKPELMENFQTFARENEFSQSQAQSLIDYHADAMKQYQELQANQWDDARKAWRDQIAADTEIGGPQMEKKMANVGRALTKFGTPELDKLLDTMGIGDHPELVRFFYRVGGAIGEADLVPGSGEGGTKDAASIMYPDQGKA